MRHLDEPGDGTWTLEVNGERLEPGDGAAITGETRLDLGAVADVEALIFDLP